MRQSAIENHRGESYTAELANDGQIRTISGFFERKED